MSTDSNVFHASVRSRKQRHTVAQGISFTDANYPREIPPASPKRERQKQVR